MNAPMDVPTGIVLGAVVAAYTAAYYTPRAVAAVRSWREARRHAAYSDYVERLVDAAVEAGVVPPEPDPFEESRPVDYDECGRCEGQGSIITIEDGLPGYRKCHWCAGSGQTAPRGGVWVR